MVRELTAELREFEGLAADFAHSEVLAWRVDARADNGGVVQIVLLWGRTGPAGAPTGWALVQGFRHREEGSSWRRSLFITYLKRPLIHLRPGETADGTWHAYTHFDHPPTGREICDFAAVHFFDSDTDRGGYRRVSGQVRNRAWQRVAGERPSCAFVK
jgi:hypothetical protein